MSMHNLCFHVEMRKNIYIFDWKKAPYLEFWFSKQINKTENCLQFDI